MLTNKWLILSTLVLLLALVGCVQVSEVGSEPTLDKRASAAFTGLVIGEEYDLSILAVEFDPPLGSLRSLPQDRKITLRVAVENKGYRKEANVQVTAKVMGDDAQDFIQEEAKIESLAPGAIEIVQFVRLIPAPHESHYVLEVSVVGSPNEKQLGNNFKTYDIRISNSR